MTGRKRRPAASIADASMSCPSLRRSTANVVDIIAKRRLALDVERTCGALLSRPCDADAATSASSPTSGPASLRQWRLIWEIDDNYNVVRTIETFF